MTSMVETPTALAAEDDDPDPLAALRAVAQLRSQLDRREAAAVRRARVQGQGWADIAHALAESRRAVRRKYGGSRLLPRGR